MIWRCGSNQSPKTELDLDQDFEDQIQLDIMSDPGPFRLGPFDFRLIFSDWNFDDPRLIASSDIKQAKFRVEFDQTTLKTQSSL